VRVGGTGRALSYLDTLTLPIIENTPNEEDLKDSMAEAMIKYPNAAGVLVRRHGVYVWGPFSFCAYWICRNNLLSNRDWLGKGQDTNRSLKSLLLIHSSSDQSPSVLITFSKLESKWSLLVCPPRWTELALQAARYILPFDMMVNFLKLHFSVCNHCNISNFHFGWSAREICMVYAFGHITCWRVSFWERHDSWAALNLVHDQSSRPSTLTANITAPNLYD